MNEENYMIFLPDDADAVTRLFHECARMRESDLPVSVGILESPYRPGLRAGIPTDTSRLDAASPGRIPLFHDVAELSSAIDGRGGLSPCTVFVGCGRMERIHEISASDFLAVADGGVRLGDIVAAAREAGLYFPLESSFLPEDITMAELIMSGAIVGTEGRFGRPRESVLAVELVTPTGETIHQGSRAVKDVGGYEIIGFLMGAGGSCGMISKVTLRLHTRPECSAFFASRGERYMLEALARRIHRACSPTFLAVFEGAAARILIARWVGIERDRGEMLPAYLRDESCGDCILIGELQGLESVVEQQLHGLVSEDTPCGASLVLIKPFLVEELRRFPVFGADALAEGDYLHISFDGAPADFNPRGSLIYRDCYPDRSHLYLQRGGVRLSSPDSIAGIADLVGAGPQSESLLRAVMRPDLRVRIEALSRREYGHERFCIPLREFIAALSPVKGGAAGLTDEYSRQAAAAERITRRILAVFDPERIMLA